jgi:archaellum component FlaC
VLAYRLGGFRPGGRVRYARHVAGEAHFDAGESVTTPEIDRKVRQLDNDVQAIYEMISRVSGTQQRHTTRLDGIDARLGDMESHLENLDTKVASLDTRVAGLDTRVASLDAKVAGLDTKVTGLDTKVGDLAERFSTMDGKLDEVLRRLAA